MYKSKECHEGGQGRGYIENLKRIYECEGVDVR